MHSHPHLPQAVSVDDVSTSPAPGLPLGRSETDELEEDSYAVCLHPETKPHGLHGHRDPARGWKAAAALAALRGDPAPAVTAPRGVDPTCFAAAVAYLRNPPNRASDQADDAAARAVGLDVDEWGKARRGHDSAGVFGRDDIRCAMKQIYRLHRNTIDSELLAGATPHDIAERHSYPVNGVIAYVNLLFNTETIGTPLALRLMAFFNVMPGQRIPPEQFSPRKERLYIAIHLGLPGLRAFDGETVSSGEQRELEDKILTMEDTRGLLEALNLTGNPISGTQS